jgi:leucyl-tRNA synthetase
MKVTRDIEDRYHFNTAISAIMELFNAMSTIESDESNPYQIPVMRTAFESLAVLISPFVPHFSEELWAALGSAHSILLTPWPSYRAEALEKDDLLIVIQVNGKLRSKFSVAADAAEEHIKQIALEDDRVKKFIGDRNIKKVIYVKGKLVNIVV